MTHPVYSNLCTLVVLVLLGTGCSDEATRSEKKAIDPRAQAFVEKMEDAYQQGDWHGALVLADSAVRYAPDLAYIHYRRGQMLSKLRRFDEADVALNQALEQDPEYRGAWYQVGHNAFLQRKYREALDFYEKEQRLAREASDQTEQGGEEQDGQALPTITTQIGRTYDLLGVPDSARLAYEEALSLDSTLGIAHAWLSELHEKQGRLDVALRHARKALERNPHDMGNVYRAGSLLLQNGQVEEAMPLLHAVVQRWPGHEGATYNLGRALQALGQEEEAERWLSRVEELQQLQEEALLAQRAVELKPDDPQRWVRLAGLMLKSGYFDKAEEAFQAALALQPGDLKLQNDLANLAVAQGDTALAVRRFQHLLRQDSSFADAWLNLGILYVMMDRPDEARAAWQQVLRYKPDDADAKAYLTRLP